MSAETDVELAVAELVDGDTPIIPPRLNQTSHARLDAAMTLRTQQALQFTCTSADDYRAGAEEVSWLRKLRKKYEESFSPLKAAYMVYVEEVRKQERVRLDQIDAAIKHIGNHLLPWKSAEEKRKAEAERQERELQKKRAEERRLAEAETVAATQGQEAAMRALERPLDIAPTQVATTVPKLSGTGVKTAKRKVLVAKRAYARVMKQAEIENRTLTDAEWEEAATIKGTDLEELLMCIGASLLLEREPLNPAVKEYLRTFASRSASPAIVKSLDAAWIKREFANRGDTFALGGVEVVLREGLG